MLVAVGDEEHKQFIRLIAEMDEKKTATALHEMFTIAAKHFRFEPGEIISVFPAQEKMSGKWLDGEPFL